MKNAQQWDEPKDGGDELLVNSSLVPIEMAGQIFHQWAAAYEQNRAHEICKGYIVSSR